MGQAVADTLSELPTRTNGDLSALLSQFHQESHMHRVRDQPL